MFLVGNFGKVKKTQRWCTIDTTDGISPIILSPMFLVGPTFMVGNPEMRAWCSKKDIPFDEHLMKSGFTDMIGCP